jgi:hypothetical protein
MVSASVRAGSAGPREAEYHCYAQAEITLDQAYLTAVTSGVPRP